MSSATTFLGPCNPGYRWYSRVDSRIRYSNRYSGRRESGYDVVHDIRGLCGRDDSWTNGFWVIDASVWILGDLGDRPGGPAG